tara:strand:+ start:300 stop:674 length:375 start_codon:yes stop_codon:yes gene_type:complete
MILEMSDTIFMEELLKRGFKYDIPEKGHFIFDARGTGHKFVKFIEVAVYYDDEGEGKEKVHINAITPGGPEQNMALMSAIGHRQNNAQDQFSEVLKIIDELQSGTFEVPEDIGLPPDPADWWKK